MKVQTSLWLDEDLNERLLAACAAARLSKADIVRQALIKYLPTAEAHANEQPTQSVHPAQQ